jgi:hypothetical protein
LLIGLLVPFVAVGVGGVVLFVRATVLSTSVGPTHVEISDHPLVPGMSYRSQTSRTSSSRVLKRPVDGFRPRTGFTASVRP